MSDSSNNSMETVSFRRFLSYIYAYEDDTKLRNVGFAKVEVRSQRVRFQVIVNGIFQKGGRPLELCLVDGNRNRIPVGQVMLQNGRGEYRGSSNMEDLWDSGLSFSQIYGICLQGAGNRRHYYMTLWREISGPARVSHNQIVVIPRDREQEETSSNDRNNDRNNDNGQMIHAAEVKEESEEAEKITEEETLAEEVEAASEEMKLEEEERLEAQEFAEESEDNVKKDAGKNADKDVDRDTNKNTDKDTDKVSEEDSEKDLQDQLESVSELISQQSAVSSSDEKISEMTGQQIRRERKEDKRMELWKRFCSRYPHVDIRPDFSREGSMGDGFSEVGRICEALRIRPNDIGRLPRNNWILAHNSFLQHAYNHSHQLILFRAEKQESETAGENHWFIGLPGEKSEQETLVAEVFGFKKFMQCKNGGFWYTEIYMGVY